MNNLLAFLNLKLHQRKFNFEELDLKTCTATYVNINVKSSNKGVDFFIDCACKNGVGWALYRVYENGYAQEIPPTGRVFKNYISSLISTYK